MNRTKEDDVTGPNDGAGIARHGHAEEDLRLLSVALAADALDALGRRAQVLDRRVAPIDRGFAMLGRISRRRIAAVPSPRTRADST